MVSRKRDIFERYPQKTTKSLLLGGNYIG